MFFLIDFKKFRGEKSEYKYVIVLFSRNDLLWFKLLIIRENFLGCVLYVFYSCYLL